MAVKRISILITLLAGYITTQCIPSGVCSGLDPTCDETALAFVLIANTGVNSSKQPIGPDFNGDGKQDLAFSSSTANANGGEAYIIFSAFERTGTIDSITGSDAVLTQGEAGGERFGTNLFAGDFNGDSVDDLIVVSQADLGGTSRGRAYLFYGGPGFTGTIAGTSADVIIDGTIDDTRIGQYGSSAGDVNDDGIDDFLLCSRDHPSGGTFRGECYLFFGSTSFSASLTVADADVTFAGATDSDRLGAHVGQSGDITGDGINDIVILVRNQDQFLVFPGTATWPNNIAGTAANAQADINTPANNANHTFAGGDVNGDGISDLLFTVDDVDGVFAFSAGAGLSGNRLITDRFADFPFVDGIDPNGGDIAVFDINRDGIDDMFLPEKNYNTATGEVRYIPGSASITGTIDRTAPEVLARFSGSVAIETGEAVAISDDSDADGIYDIWIAANPNGAFSAGVISEIYLFPSGVFEAGGDFDESSATLRIEIADTITQIANYPL